VAHLLNHYTSKGRTWQDEANWLAQDSRDMAERDWLSLQQAYEESQQIKAELADKDAQIVWLTAQLAEKNR